MNQLQKSTLTLKERLARGDRLNVFAVSRSFHPNQIEMYALQGGFDGFWIDHEHTGFTIDQIESATRAGRACGLSGFVRLAPTDYALVTRCLESGACGVMAAQVSTPEQAEQFVSWAKFAPRGQRGLNNWGVDGNFSLKPIPEFCEESNRNSFVAIQIETLEALERCNEIASINGVDHLFIGPADLSQALGITGQMMHPRLLEAIDRIAQACAAHGKSFGAVSFSPVQAEMLLEKGCRLISMTSDVRTFQQGITAVKETFQKLFAR